MSTTALQLITGALRLIQAVRKTEAITADEAEDGLAALNELLGSWSNETLNITSRVTESFNITSGTSYTIGSGQTLNTTRPISIEAAFIRIGNIDYPLTKITDEEYSSIAYKSLGTTIPQYFNYNNGYPYGTIKIYPALVGNVGLHLLSEKPLTEIATINTEIDLPAGTKRALKYNLAVDLAPEYGKQVSEVVYKIAKESLGQIRLSVAKNRPIKQRYDNSIAGNNIYTGYYK